MTKVALEDVKEVRECHSANEANQVLRYQGWKLLEFKIEKVRKPTILEDSHKEPEYLPRSSPYNEFVTNPRYKFHWGEKESLEVVYIVGRYE